MIAFRKSSDRGHADHGWLKSRHSFSFADYHDPRHMGFGNLRVINEDRVAPGTGFGTHGHRDMEIVSYVLAGELAHKDSMGTGETGAVSGIIRPGDVQRMSAGRGVQHSEFNHAPDETTHFLQIWIEPSAARHRAGLRAEALRRRVQARHAAAGRVARRPRRLGDDQCRRVDLGGARRWRRSDREPIDPGRKAYVQAVRGSVDVNGQRLEAGDALALSGERSALDRSRRAGRGAGLRPRLMRSPFPFPSPPHKDHHEQHPQEPRPRRPHPARPPVRPLGLLKDRRLRRHRRLHRLQGLAAGERGRGAGDRRRARWRAGADVRLPRAAGRLRCSRCSRCSPASSSTTSGPSTRP